MAAPPTRRSPCWNFNRTSKDELAGATPTKGSDTFTSIPIVSYAPTLVPTTAHVATPSSDNKLFKQFIKAYLETQVLSQTDVDPKPCK